MSVSWFWPDWGADDPPEYDPEADAADRAGEWWREQCELTEVEAEEARDAIRD